MGPTAPSLGQVHWTDATAISVEYPTELSDGTECSGIFTLIGFPHFSVDVSSGRTRFYGEEPKLFKTPLETQKTSEKEDDGLSPKGNNARANIGVLTMPEPICCIQYVVLAFCWRSVSPSFTWMQGSVSSFALRDTGNCAYANSCESLRDYCHAAFANVRGPSPQNGTLGG